MHREEGNEANPEDTVNKIEEIQGNFRKDEPPCLSEVHNEVNEVGRNHVQH